MTNHELADALRCTSTVHDAEWDCDACPFYDKQDLPADMVGEYPEDWLCQCDVDRVALMTADALENTTTHVAVLQKTIEDLRRRVPQWVSVEERLPEKHDDVLVLVSGKHGNITFERTQMIGAYLGDEGWFCGEYPDWDNPGVTHWMPLPEAPGNLEAKEGE